MFADAFFANLATEFAAASITTWGTVQFLFVYGGWILSFWLFFYMMFFLFVDRMMGVWLGKQKFVLLAINVPKDNEQTPRAVENFFNHLAGAHATSDLIEKYWFGEFQLWCSLEIVSIEGYLQFLMWIPQKWRDLVEAAMYAQYPDAEITEVEDYVDKMPTHFPNATHDCWGTEFNLAREEAFPINTYREFEHMVTDQFFKDPMAALLETMSRVGKGEEVWFQIFVKPLGKSWQKSVFQFANDLALKFIQSRTSLANQFPVLHKGEMRLVEDIHQKATKNGFKCKIRVVYVADKEHFNKKKIQFGLVGALKQFSRDDANSLKPLYSEIATSTHYIFKDVLLNERKTALMTAYKKRSGIRGGPQKVFNIEELATLWHFPMAHAVKAPTLQVTMAKRQEGPGGLPFETGEEYVAPATSKIVLRRRPLAEEGELTTETTVSTDDLARAAPPPDNLPFV